MKKKLKVLKIFVYFSATMFIAGIISFFCIIVYFGKDLPNHKSLENYNPALTTRLYSSDGKFLKEYAKEKRLFVPIEQIPDLVKNAFISAEDSSFYKHIGVNPIAIISALKDNILSKYSGVDRFRGGSTITQQVAKNFLLTNERTIDRKIKEAILSIRMDSFFTKDKILELYLNQIFLGNRSYGVASAALNYFNKSLDELKPEEAAILASLPKAPAKLDPTRNDPKNAMYRRNWVLSRMYELGYLTSEEYEKAKNTPIILKEKNIEEVSNGEFFSQEVAKQFVENYGKEEILEGGNVITTTIDPKLQELADRYLKLGIERYDIRHGFRGAIDNIYTEEDFENKWGDLINEYDIKSKSNNIRDTWVKAVVLDIDDEKEQIKIGLKEINLEDKITEDDIVEIEENEFIIQSSNENLLLTGYIPLKNLLWAKKYIDVYEVGEEIKKPSDVGLVVGDVIVVEQDKQNKNEYSLKQIPAINGALIAMNPHNGKILAMMGGYIDSQTDFNRATQAERQPGSVLKTFAYIAALENGFTPAKIIIDEEVELDQGPGRPPYKPRNSTDIFYGPVTLRTGLEKSINITTVRIGSEIGLGKVTEVIRRFGINNRPRRIYSIVLGSTETNLVKLVRAYSMIVNGGKVIEPNVIEKIQNKDGKTIFSMDNRKCLDCEVEKNINIEELIIPTIIDNRQTILDSDTAYQITSMLEGVVQRGTGWRAKAIGKPIGAKTGTTNNANDAWFIGFSPDLVVGVYMGFDKPSTLGENETGSSVAGPIFVNFMKQALKDEASVPFRVPSSVDLIKIDAKTGYYPTPASLDKDIVLEAFKKGDQIVKFEEEISDDDLDNFMTGQDGLYNFERPIIIKNIQEKPIIEEAEETEQAESGLEGYEDETGIIYNTIIPNYIETTETQNIENEYNIITTEPVDNYIENNTNEIQ